MNNSGFEGLSICSWCLKRKVLALWGRIRPGAALWTMKGVSAMADPASLLSCRRRGGLRINTLFDGHGQEQRAIVSTSWPNNFHAKVMQHKHAFLKPSLALGMNLMQQQNEKLTTNYFFCACMTKSVFLFLLLLFFFCFCFIPIKCLPMYTS